MYWLRRGELRGQPRPVEVEASVVMLWTNLLEKCGNVGSVSVMAAYELVLGVSVNEHVARNRLLQEPNHF